MVTRDLERLCNQIEDVRYCHHCQYTFHNYIYNYSSTTTTTTTTMQSATTSLSTTGIFNRASTSTDTREIPHSLRPLTSPSGFVYPAMWSFPPFFTYVYPFLPLLHEGLTPVVYSQLTAQPTNTRTSNNALDTAHHLLESVSPDIPRRRRCR